MVVRKWMGEKIMKLFIKKTSKESRVEILLSFIELDQMISALCNLRESIIDFKNVNINNDSLGFTHLHMKDCGLLDGKGKEDIVLYVDLSDT